MKSKIHAAINPREIGDVIHNIAQEYGLLEAVPAPDSPIAALRLAKQRITDQSDYLDYLEGYMLCTFHSNE